MDLHTLLFLHFSHVQAIFLHLKHFNCLDFDLSVASSYSLACVCCMLRHTRHNRHMKFGSSLALVLNEGKKSMLDEGFLFRCRFDLFNSKVHNLIIIQVE